MEGVEWFQSGACQKVETVSFPESNQTKILAFVDDSGENLASISMKPRFRPVG